MVNGPDDNADDLPARICDLRVPAGLGGFAEGEANAALIAAAPDLLAACDEADTAFAVINISSDHPLTPQARSAMRAAWAKVNAAMAKATGKPDRFAEANQTAAASSGGGKAGHSGNG